MPITRRKSYRQLGIFALLLSGFIALLFTGGDKWERIGLILLGAFFSFLAVFAVEEVKRAAQVSDLARALYEELANRVVRCVFDFEDPWEGWVEHPQEIDVLRLRKFMPESPVVYAATASQIALLGDEAPQAIISFYSRLAACQKDMEDIANDCERRSCVVQPRQVQMIAGRLQRTLCPGLQALRTLSKMVEGYEKIEAAAIAEADKYFKHERAGQTTRQRLAHYCRD